MHLKCISEDTGIKTDDTNICEEKKMVCVKGMALKQGVVGIDCVKSNMTYNEQLKSKIKRVGTAYGINKQEKIT